MRYLLISLACGILFYAGCSTFAPAKLSLTNPETGMPITNATILAQTRSAKFSKWQLLNLTSTASVVDRGKLTRIIYNESLVELLVATADEAGNHQDWELETNIVEPGNCVKFSSGRFGVMKALLGSRGFSGLTAISVEVVKPYRVIATDGGAKYVSTLPEDSQLLLENQALWRAIISSKKSSR